ncbi:MAG: glycoside hydrolase family 75 protein [Thermodesulfobacteriota bacterium]
MLQKAKPAVIHFSDDTIRWQGQTVFVGKLDNEVVIVKASYMTLTTDGATGEIRACDRTAQAETALRGPVGKPIDANAIPYLVLPWCGGAADRKKCKAHPPYRQLGLQMGDLAAVITGEKIAFAIAADLGPEKRFGEGSIELHRRLGHETIGKDPADPRCAKNESLNSEVVLVIFPGSNDRWLPADELEKKGRALWNRLLQEGKVLSE